MNSDEFLDPAVRDLEGVLCETLRSGFLRNLPLLLFHCLLAGLGLVKDFNHLCAIYHWFFFVHGGLSKINVCFAGSIYRCRLRWLVCLILNNSSFVCLIYLNSRSTKRYQRSIASGQPIIPIGEAADFIMRQRRWSSDLSPGSTCSH